ncbi:MAG: 1-acyl-sn-glycerol-3-phosphate acyltransferase [Tannerella sp.]|jgi:1-acyl-sn-glycerol-3-phosphate acyltransferase|nr:1-acyl-sn-glycerol-3-phosphate acyltransferase [Tannerella sp.]
MTDFFVSIFKRCAAHRKLTVVLSLLLTLALTPALLTMEYREDIAEFLPDSKENERINTIYRHIGTSGKLMIFFSHKDSAQHDAERIIEAIDSFAVRLEENDSLRVIPEVIARIDESLLPELMDFIRSNVPYFLTENDFRRIDSLLTDEYVASCLKNDKQLLTMPSGAIMKDNIVGDPLHLFAPLWQELNAFSAGENRELNDGYIFSDGGRKGTVIVTSPYGVSETDRNAALLTLIDHTVRQVETSFPDMRISCFGAPAIAVANADRIKSDSLLAVSLSVLLILVLLIFFFRNMRHILLVFLSVFFGWLFALALLAVFKGSISIIALGISSIFIGIAINYPLHFIDRTRHQPDVGQALKEIASPLLIGNITTVSAFLSLVFIPSNAMRDMGLSGSLLLAGTILFVLIFLPHLVRRHGKHSSKSQGFGDSKIFDRFVSFAPERKKWIIWSVLILTCLFLYLSRFTTFEPDMNKINYMTDRQREDMQHMMQLLEKRDRDIVYFVSEGATLDDALSASEQNAWLLDTLVRRGWIESISGTGVFLASGAEQQRRIDRWNGFWQPRREWLLQQLEASGQAEGFRKGSFEPFAQLLKRDFTVQDETFFAPLVSLLAENYIVRDENRHMLVHLLYCSKDRTAALEDAIRSDAGNAFVFDSRDIGRRMVDALSDDFNYVLFFCGFIVFLFLTISFGRLELSLMTFLPLAVSWIWILGIMQLTGMSFNIVNIILATFIFGQGDDYTIFIADGLIYEYAFRRRMLASHKRSIMLSSLIMFSGIGTLIFARHPALHSLAEVTIVGMFSVVMMAYIIPPFIFRWLTQRKDGGYREVPVTCRRVLYSVYSFAAFLVGSILVTAVGFSLFIFGKTEKRRLRYHTFLCRVSRFVVKRIPGVKFRLDNLSHESFERPAVIISNHQSHLDLKCLLMLTPRLVILTNDWVWNNPFYGQLIRYADFYPISGGIEHCIDELADRMKNGYSIVIFPEGTRSEDSSILRFHRGAFYLAEMLTADILPIILHGVGDVLPRKDFMLREGRITVEIHPRIVPGDTRYGTDYAARTKQLRQWYGEQFGAMCTRLQDARYYKSFVLHNYFYKGASVERSVSAALKKTDCFARWIDAHHGNDSILVVNSGYGEFAFLFAMVHRQCRITAVDRDEDRTALARACAGLPPNLHVCLETDLPADATFDKVYLLRPDSAQTKAYSHYNPIIINEWKNMF